MNKVLAGMMLIGSFSIYAESNCKSTAENAITSKYASSVGHILQTNSKPTEEMNLENGKKLEVWTGYISKTDKSNEMAAVVIVNAQSCEVLAVNLIN